MISTSLIGEADGRPGDPYYLFLPTDPLNARLIGRTHSTKDNLEDLQLLHFLNVTSRTLAVRGPISVRPGSDPPDRVVSWDGLTCNVELTTLTLEQLRPHAARVRKVARELQDAVDADPHAFEHLAGQQVSVHWMSDEALSTERARDDVVRDEVLTVLSYSPTRIPPTSPDIESVTSAYGEVLGSVVLTTNAILEPSRPPQITGTIQSALYQSEVRTVLSRLIAEKDIPDNDILVVTTSSPDSRGHVCPADQWMLQAIVDSHQPSAPRPVHLRAIFVTDFISGAILCEYIDPNADQPWGVPSATPPT